MQIGKVTLANNVVTAPIAGFTRRPYRDLLHQMGAGLVFDEMVSATALVYNNPKTLDLLVFRGEASPRAVQLCCSSPLHAGEAGEIVVAQGAELIDINMGCPAPKVVKNGEGSALLKDHQLAAAIVTAVKKRVQVPVTAKMRLGWDENSLCCVELARKLEAAGVDAITVHGRTRQQFYSGTADRKQIALVKQAVEIPVIANGDIFTPQDAVSMLADTGCDGVMLGRGMLGNPWLVRDVLLALAQQQPLGKPPLDQVLQFALQHVQAEIALAVALSTDQPLESEKRAVKAMRTHLAYYLKGFRHAANLRGLINQTDTYQGLRQLFAEFEQNTD